MSISFSNLFNLKSLLFLLALTGLFWFQPETLFSATTPPPVQETAPLKATVAPKTATPPSSTTKPSSTAAVHKKTAADEILSEPFDNIKRPSLLTQAALLSMLSLLPFIIMILTSFLKVVVVLSLLRTALGVQQAPPNQIINGVAFLISLFIMYPTGAKMYDAAHSFISETHAPESLLSTGSSAYIIGVATVAREPLRDFLKKNSSTKHQAQFYRLAYRGLPEQHRDDLKVDDFMVLVPSFITSQLKEAFEIGVLIYIPFFVIDLVTSNILLAMGMMMLSPVTISMPLKLFLLVMLDGWTILIDGLVKTFQ